MYLCTYIHVCYSVLASLTFCRNNVRRMCMCIHIAFWKDCIFKINPIKRSKQHSNRKTLRPQIESSLGAIQVYTYPSFMQVYIVCYSGVLPSLLFCQNNVYACISVYMHTLMLQRVAVFASQSKQCMCVDICIHIRRKSSLYLPLGSVNLVLKAIGTPDEI